MARGKEPYLPRIEWEGLQGKWEIETLKESPTLPVRSEKIQVWRDEQYKIKATVTGTPSGLASDLLQESGEPGTVTPNFEIEGSGLYGEFEYVLSNCIIRKISVKAPERFEADLKTYRVRRTPKRHASQRTAWLTEWYLNAHRGSMMIYPRLVERGFKEEYRRKREFLGEEVSFGGGWADSTERCAFVESPEVSLIVQPVPKEFEPPWSKCLSIEYREDLDGVPNSEVRNAVASVLSFIMGRPLISVGFTAFEERGYPIEQIALSPPEEDLVTSCQRADQPPVELDLGRPTDIFEVLLRELVPRYLKLNDELNLDEALWGYWLSERLPLGANLPVLATSLELIKKSWYSSKKSKSRGVYLPKSEFDELLKDELAAIEAKLDGVEYGDRMMRRMRGTFNMGANESLEFFFGEIGLPVGSVEWEAIGARNSMVHGSLALLDESRYQNMIDNTFSYRTLFNRVLLKILGYEGTYVDYSTKGWPERAIDEPMAGSV